MAGLNSPSGSAGLNRPKDVTTKVPRTNAQDSGQMSPRRVLAVCLAASQQRWLCPATITPPTMLRALACLVGVLIQTSHARIATLVDGAVETTPPAPAGGVFASTNALLAVPPVDVAPGLEAEFLESSTLLPVVARHVAARNSSKLALLRWTHYFAVYEKALERFRNKPNTTVVEVGTFCGGSAQIWAEWLGPEVRVVTIDIYDYTDVFADWPNIVAIQGDQEDPKFWNEKVFPVTGRIDALIDDGSHTYMGQMITLREAMPWIKPGGFLAIEDTHTSYYAPKGTCVMVAEARIALVAALIAGDAGGPDQQELLKRFRDNCQGVSVSFMDEMQALVDVLHFWWFDMSMGGGKDAGVPMPLVRRARSSMLSLEWLNWFARAVKSIDFHDSIVMIHRWPSSGFRTGPLALWGGRVLREKVSGWDHFQPMLKVLEVDEMVRLGPNEVQAIGDPFLLLLLREYQAMTASN
jgi:hypothetical protein